MMDERKMPPPMGPGGPPPEGGPGPGPGGPMARLGAEYSFEILAPAGVPVKQLTSSLRSRPNSIPAASPWAKPIWWATTSQRVLLFSGRFPDRRKPSIIASAVHSPRQNAPCHGCGRGRFYGEL